jgi:hypothetical protein
VFIPSTEIGLRIAKKGIHEEIPPPQKGKTISGQNVGSKIHRGAGELPRGYAKLEASMAFPFHYGLFFDKSLDRMIFPI